MILLQQRLVLAAASWNYKASGALLLLLIWNQKPRFKISRWKQSFLLKNENSETKISTILLHERKKKKKSEKTTRNLYNLVVLSNWQLMTSML